MKSFKFFIALLLTAQIGMIHASSKDTKDQSSVFTFPAFHSSSYAYQGLPARQATADTSSSSAAPAASASASPVIAPATLKSQDENQRASLVQEQWIPKPPDSWSYRIAKQSFEGPDRTAGGININYMYVPSSRKNSDGNIEEGELTTESFTYVHLKYIKNNTDLLILYQRALKLIPLEYDMNNPHHQESVGVLLYFFEKKAKAEQFSLPELQKLKDSFAQCQQQLKMKLTAEQRFAESLKIVPLLIRVEN